MGMDRSEREIDLAAHIGAIRDRAAHKQAAADRISGATNNDPAFWTQPAYGNAAGRSFARSRDRERAKLLKAAEVAAEARALRDQADATERRGVVMAGDAAKSRAAKITSVEVSVGAVVDTTFYGNRKVLKVNAKSVLVEGAFGPLKIGKEFVRVAA